MRCVLLSMTLLVGVCLLGAGCGGVRTYPASGTVTLDGKPLATGTIYFRSEQDTQASAESESAPIADGKYQLQAKPGANRVEVRAMRDIPGKKSPFGGPFTESIIPMKYNAQSTLSATVKSDGPNEFNFDLKSK